MSCAPELCKVTLHVDDNGILSFLSHRLPPNLCVYYQNPHDLVMGFDGEWAVLKCPYRLDLLDLPTEPTAKQEAKKRWYAEAMRQVDANCNYWCGDDASEEDKKAFKEKFIRHHQKELGLDRDMTEMLAPAPGGKRVRGDNNKNNGAMLVGKEYEDALDDVARDDKKAGDTYGATNKGKRKATTAPKLAKFKEQKSNSPAPSSSASSSSAPTPPSASSAAPSSSSARVEIDLTADDE